MKIVALVLTCALAPAKARLADRFLARRHGRSGLVDHAVNHVERALRARGAAPAASNATTHLYTAAALDHFDASVASAPVAWSQRFYADASFWGGDGWPVFLYVGGEGPLAAPSARLHMYELARAHGALVLALEHRFYGESRPTADLSDASLAFLTSAQALADLARFIAHVNALSPGAPDAASSPPLTLAASTARSRWIAFGGSYPGNLATWLRLRYPALVAGAVGSSAPVFAEV